MNKKQEKALNSFIDFVLVASSLKNGRNTVKLDDIEYNHNLPMGHWHDISKEVE